ncbi:MAG TPA: glycosyl hydrolase [Thermoplasmata archaeon]|nr:glycosyl hydrolase [Thermoplasmata archaeon]
MIYGVSGLRQPPQNPTQDFDKILQLGLWVRDGVDRPEWTTVYSLADRGVNIVANLGKAAMPGNFSLADWEAKVRDSVARYPKVRAWEIWNEPQNPGERQGYWDGTPAHYVDLLRTAYPAIKSANPSAIVLGFGGLPANVLNTPAQPFRDEVLSSGGGAYFDAFAVHVYPSVKPPEPGMTLDKRLVRIRNGLSDHLAAVRKPIWLTETAAGASWWDQREYIQKAFPLFEGLGIAAVFWFTLRDGKQSIDGANYGLLDSNGNPKEPAFSEFARAVRARP